MQRQVEKHTESWTTLRDARLEADDDNGATFMDNDSTACYAWQ